MRVLPWHPGGLDWPRLVRPAASSTAVDFVLPALPLHLGGGGISKEAEMSDLQATQKKVEGSRKNPYAPDDDKRRIHYSYIRRTGTCPHPKHDGRKSSSFIGVNENGWLFHCSHTEDAGHAFINQPPEPSA